jgi:hypothetical protein
MRSSEGRRAGAVASLFTLLRHRRRAAQAGVSFMDPLAPFLLAVAFAAAYLHVRVPSRRRSGGGLARLILAGGTCLLLLYGLYELSVQREFKPENIPIRIDMPFIAPALLGLMIVAVIAYIYGLGSDEAPSAPGKTPAPPPELAAGQGGTVTPGQVNERLAHLLPKAKNEQKKLTLWLEWARQCALSLH